MVRQVSDRETGVCEVRLRFHECLPYSFDQGYRAQTLEIRHCQTVANLRGDRNPLRRVLNSGLSVCICVSKLAPRANSYGISETKLSYQMVHGEARRRAEGDRR